MQISVDVYNEPFAIKCCAMYDPNESSAVYLLTSYDKYAVCGVDFSPNQLLCRKYLVEETFDHLPGNEKDQLSPICRYGTWRLQTPPYDDTQSIYKRTWKRGKTPERNSTTCEWVSPTCREKPEHQCSTTIYCQCNLLFHIRQKKIIVFITWPAKIRVCPAKKISGRSSWPATYCSLFWALPIW